MRPISARRIWLRKQVMPAVVAIGLLIFLVSTFFDEKELEIDPYYTLKMAAFILLWGGLFFYRWWRKTWVLADEVLDGDDVLVIRRGGTRYRVRLDDIANVNWSPDENPRRATIQLRTPGPLGETVAFIPRRASLSQGAEPALSDLVRRIDAMRKAGQFRS
jgi:hypothetical protein